MASSSNIDIQDYIIKNIKVETNPLGGMRLILPATSISKTIISTVTSTEPTLSDDGSNYNLFDCDVVDFLGKYSNYYQVNFPQCLFKLVDEKAVVPSKVRESDAGYDLTIIKLHKQLTPKTALYDTGIQLSIPNGYYIEVVPRSSISKTGYILANNIGIIDAAYRGNIYVALMKVDESMPDIELPSRICQLIVRKQERLHFVETDNISSSSRGSGGFGSTNTITNANA